MAFFSSILLACSAIVSARQVSISVDVSDTRGKWNPINRFFGCDEPNYAYYPKGSALMKELGALGRDQTYFRTHNLLSTGNGSLTGVPGLKWGSTNVYTEDDDGNPVYNFTIVDQILDSYMVANVKPYLEISFMPRAMAVDSEPYFFEFDPAAGPDSIYTGWTHQPQSYEKWRDLIYELAKHSVDRYGEDEVRSWFWEVWNEPQGTYWNGTAEEFYMLHDFAIAGVQKALPDARVGGPEVVGDPGFLDDFLKHCSTGHNEATGRTGSPLDFLSFHAKGAPLFINGTDGKEGYLQMNISTQLNTIDDMYAVIASYDQYKDLPIVIGEMDPDGCAACTSEAYGYRNGLFYGAFTAASFTRALDLAASRGVNLLGALTWAFEYEQTALIPDETVVFDGFRVLSTQGIDKPVLNFHRMWSMMSGDRVKAESSGKTPIDVVLSEGILGEDSDVGSVATFDDDAEKLYVFAWNYHDNHVDFPDAHIALDVEGLPKSFTRHGSQIVVTHYRVDDEHSNSYSKWLAMGSPQHPSDEQFNQLKKGGKLETLGEAKQVHVSKDGKLAMEFSLPIRALSLLVFEKQGGKPCS